MSFFIFLKISEGFSISCEVAKLRLSLSPAWVISHPIIPCSRSLSLSPPPPPPRKAGQSKTRKRKVIGGEMNQVPRWWLKPGLQTAKSVSARPVAQREAEWALQQTGLRGWQHLHMELNSWEIKELTQRSAGIKKMRVVVGNRRAQPQVNQ